MNPKQFSFIKPSHKIIYKVTQKEYTECRYGVHIHNFKLKFLQFNVLYHSHLICTQNLGHHMVPSTRHSA